MKKLICLMFLAASTLFVSCAEDDSVIPTTQTEQEDSDSTGGVDDKGKI